jgi:hypothetical protein
MALGRNAVRMDACCQWAISGFGCVDWNHPDRIRRQESSSMAQVMSFARRREAVRQ